MGFLIENIILSHPKLQPKDLIQSQLTNKN